MKEQDIDSAVVLMRDAVEAWDHLNALKVPESVSGHRLTLWQRLLIHLETEKAVSSAYQEESADVVEDLNPTSGLVAVGTLKPNPTNFTLTNDQEKAWAKLEAWFPKPRTDAPYFLLRGYAGTGKTFLLKKLLGQYKKTVYLTAPTNKAAKVLGSMVQRSAKTIYSLLGLRMVAEEEQMVLSLPESMPELVSGCLIVVDEAGTLNDDVFRILLDVADAYAAKILFMGDPAQLPPVKQRTSAVWDLVEGKENRALLKEVKRYDNELLALAIELRRCVKLAQSGEKPKNPIKDDNNGVQGVFLHSTEEDWLEALFQLSPEPADFLITKVVAWRNKVVNRYNEIIRRRLFGTAADETPYFPKELLLVASPVESGGNVIATIDEEMTIETVMETIIEIDSLPVPSWRMFVRTDSGVGLTLHVPTDDGEVVLQDILSKLADKARRSKGSLRKETWKRFWAVKNQFHEVRYAYCMTAHRLQGSTVTNVFVDQQDMLSNRIKSDAWSCLYVAETRPTTSFHTF